MTPKARELLDAYEDGVEEFAKAYIRLEPTLEEAGEVLDEVMPGLTREEHRAKIEWTSEIMFGYHGLHNPH